MSLTRASKLIELKEILAQQLCETDRLKQPEGLPTGFSSLDRFLESGGIPKGHLTLLKGGLGHGATSLWIETALQIVAKKKWVAWINSDIPLAPLALEQRGFDFSRFITVEKPESDGKLFWLLQELMSADLFECIACDLGSPSRPGQPRKPALKEHHLRKLQAQARASHVALVFLTDSSATNRAVVRHARVRNISVEFPHGSVATVFSLILNFKNKQLVVERALHRPTPHHFTRSLNYARFTTHSCHASESITRIGAKTEHANSDANSRSLSRRKRS